MTTLTTPAPGFWDDAIRTHDRSVYLSVLALGISPDRARELVQMTWTKLIEQHAKGALAAIELPGLAIGQARFFALADHQRHRTHVRVLAAVPDPPPPPDALRTLESRQELVRVLAALETCSPTARRVFEQLAGEVDATTDGYALGMTMLHLLTRQEPWRIAQEKPALNVSAPLRAFLDKLVAPDRRARFASAKDALAALEVLGERRAKPRRSWRPMLYAAAAVALAGSGLGVHHAMTGHPAPDRRVALVRGLGATATVRLLLDRSDLSVPVWVDATQLEGVSDRQDIPVTPGPHHLLVDSQGHACIRDLVAVSGEVIEIACHVDPSHVQHLGDDESTPDVIEPRR